MFDVIISCRSVEKYFWIKSSNHFNSLDKMITISSWSSVLGLKCWCLSKPKRLIFARVWFPLMLFAKGKTFHQRAGKEKNQHRLQNSDLHFFLLTFVSSFSLIFGGFLGIPPPDVLKKQMEKLIWLRMGINIQSVILRKQYTAC